MKITKTLVAVVCLSLIAMIGISSAGILETLGLRKAAKVTKADIYVTSHLKGPQGDVARAIQDSVKDITFTPKQLGSCGETTKTINETKDPVFLIWSNSQPQNGAKAKQNCTPDFEKLTPVAVTWAPYEICTTKNFVLADNKEYKWGNNKWQPQVSQEKMMNDSLASRGIKLKTVTFGGSGPTLAGLINGDVDIAWIATGVAKKAVEAGSIKCLWTTGSTQWGQKPISDLIGKDKQFPLGRLGMVVVAKNIPNIDEIIKKLDGPVKKVMAAQDNVDTKAGLSRKELNDFVDYAKSMAYVY
jgi:hypothetical protein